jgi:hypothetical protein
VVAALVLYKTLDQQRRGLMGSGLSCINGQGVWSRRQEFIVTADKIRELREAHRRLEEVAEEVRRELNDVLVLYASHSRDLHERLRPYLEVDFKLGERSWRRRGAKS